MRFAILAVALALLVTACVTQETEVSGGNTTPSGQVVRDTEVVRETVVIPEGKGRLVFTLVGDPVASVSRAMLTVDAVEAFSQEDGWVVVNGDERTYDLVGLTADALLGDRVVDSGQYSQVRMRISSLQVTDAQGTFDARLLNESVVLPVPVTLAQGGTETVTFDFDLAQSARRTQDGQYVFLPVVRIITREGVTVSGTPAAVIIEQGTVVRDIVYYTDVRGETTTERVVPPAAVIVIDRGEVRVVNDTTVVNNTTVINNTVVQNNAVVVNDTRANNTTAGNVTRNTTRANNTSNTSGNMTANTTG